MSASKATQWPKGTSGNPKGKPKGKGPFAAIREAIAADMPAIIKKLAGQAKGGDVAAARLLMERLYPALKAVEPACELALPDGTLTEKGSAILTAVANGEIAPSQGASLISAVGTLAKVVEVDELAARVAALEKQLEKH